MKMTDILAVNQGVILSDLVGQLSDKSKAVYLHDARSFARWLDEHLTDISAVDRSTLILYRTYLNNSFAKSTAARMLSVARLLLDEAVRRGLLARNPAKEIKGFKLANETPHTALTKAQAKELLAAIDRTTLIGLRDYALLMLLLRTGIRRSECAALRLEDIKLQQGHHVAVIQHGKGDKRRVVKLPVDVFRAIEQYLASAGRKNDAPGSSLFCGCNKAGQSTRQGISDKLVERVVIKYAQLIGLHDLTPHGLRATFITLAMEGGAKLEQVQYASGHSDPRTTERYQKRKLNLDDNAVDYINGL